MRRTDLLARYGGEEFAVLLRDCTPIRAVMVLDELRAVNPDGHTFSAGIAEWDGQEGPERLVGRADRALDEAKYAGRDRIVAATTRSDHPEQTAEKTSGAASRGSPHIDANAHRGPSRGPPKLRAQQ
jgi:predicted signal transduction protein with EAL and GGDEF domain